MTQNARKGSADKTIPHTRIEEEEMIWKMYKCGVKLGQGAFGKVYQVQHQDTELEWAMKTVNKEKAGSSALKLLEREVAILKRVSHPNIIQLNEVFETAKKMFLVMELCEGGELADALKERKIFMESEVKVITKELASAIAYLHKHDIVHRDMKLENILVKKFPDATIPADKLQIKITDFGLSITKSGVGHDNMMQDFCGTPNYMAPEIIDNKTYSQQCDVWALGVIVYTFIGIPTATDPVGAKVKPTQRGVCSAIYSPPVLIAGRTFCGYPPFRAKEEEVLYDQIKKGDIDFTTDEVWKEVTKEAKDCISKMLEIDPAHRLTASEVQHHHWITKRQNYDQEVIWLYRRDKGDQDRQSANVLQLMKEWGKDLKIGNDDEDEGGEDKSAIKNGETESADNEENLANEDSQQKLEETTRKGSGGTKKPGSGGKSSTRAQSRTSRATPSSLKPTNNNTRASGSKSPNPPTSRVTTSSLGTNRPITQHNNRATPTLSSNKQTAPNKAMTSTRSTPKPNPIKK